MTRQYETREGFHGIEWAAFSKITKTPTGELDTTVVPTVFTGARSVSIETTQESTDFYADNRVHLTLWGAETSEGEMLTYQLPRTFILEHLGKRETANGAIIDGGSRANFILQYLRTATDELGGGYQQLVVWYNVQAGPPTREDTTNEDSIEIQEITIPLKASPNNLVMVDGKPVTCLTLDITNENIDLLDLAYEQIIMPDTVIPEG